MNIRRWILQTVVLMLLVITSSFAQSSEPTLRIVTNVVNNNGGTAIAHSWRVAATSTNGDGDGSSPGTPLGSVYNLVAGKRYTVSVTGGPSGYAQTLTGRCSIASAASGTNYACTVTEDDIDPPSLTIAVSSNVSATSSDGNPVAVTYSPATLSGGAPPYTGPTCSPESGSAFALGSTTVSCSGSDSTQLSASQSFTVTVNDGRITNNGFLPVVPGGAGAGMATRAAYACGVDPVIMSVTNLNDSGAGSLRDALEASVPRIVIFEVGGMITLQTDIGVLSPCLTVAGQTAPSPGITVKDSGINLYSHDILLQHIRIRPGDTIRPSDCYNDQCGVAMPQTYGHDGLEIYRASPDADVYNIVIDHVSISWAAGKNTLNWTRDSSQNAVTYWRNIISEALYRASNVIVNASGGDPSSLGMLLGSQSGATSIIQNLFAHNSDRNPEIHDGDSVDVINNVIYDWGKDANNCQWCGTFFYAGGGSGTPSYATVAGNKYIAGPPPVPNTPLYGIGIWDMNPGSAVYVANNFFDSSRQEMIEFFNNMSWDPTVSTPQPALPNGMTISTDDPESFVLAHAGARPQDRDAVDMRIVQEVQQRTGNMISSQNEVGGWPILTPSSLPLSVPANPHTVTSSGYTVIEEWLHAYANSVE